MGQGFPITRWVVLTCALAGLVWLVLSRPVWETGMAEPTADRAHPVASTSTALSNAAMVSTALPADLLTRDMAQTWRKHRSQLMELGRSYRAEPDSARSCVLRDSIEDLLHRSIREVHEHRLLHARSSGRIDMVRYLEHALTSFPEDTSARNNPEPGSLTDKPNQAMPTLERNGR